MKPPFCVKNAPQKNETTTYYKFNKSSISSISSAYSFSVSTWCTFMKPTGTRQPASPNNLESLPDLYFWSSIPQNKANLPTFQQGSWVI